MPVKSRRTAAKMLLLAPVAPIQVFAVQKLVNGEPVAGAVALVFGLGLAALYVAIQEYDIPYEDKILDIAAENVDPEDVEAVATTGAEVAQETVDDTQESDP